MILLTIILGNLLTITLTYITAVAKIADRRKNGLQQHTNHGKVFLVVGIIYIVLSTVQFYLIDQNTKRDQELIAAKHDFKLASLKLSNDSAIKKINKVLEENGLSYNSSKQEIIQMITKNSKRIIVIQDTNSEKTALRYLDELKHSPSKSNFYYDQLDALSIPIKNYNSFKTLVKLSNDLWNKADKEKIESSIYQNPYQLFKNRTMPFLITHFPEQVYRDISLDKEFELSSMLQDNSNYEREKFIKILNEVTNESSIKNHKYAIKSMMIDICGYSPELLPVFEKTFGKKKINEIKKLWNEEEWKGVDRGYQSLISKLGA